MKKKRIILQYIPIAISLFLPVLTLVLYCFGYTVTLFSYTVLSAVSALIFIVSYLLSKNQQSIKALAFLPIFSLINLVLYVYKSKSVIVLICIGICFIISAVIAEKACKTSKSKIISVLTSAVLSVPLILVSLLFVASGKFSVNTVVDRIYSPEKTYYAEIVDSDQGALGGNTIVYACKNSKLNLLVFTIIKTPQRVYIGDWREYETMQILWKNENCLIINSEEYNIE